MVATRVLDHDIRISKLETTSATSQSVTKELTDRDKVLWEMATRDDIEALKDRLEALASEVRELRAKIDGGRNALDYPVLRQGEYPLPLVFTAISGRLD